MESCLKVVILKVNLEEKERIRSSMVQLKERDRDKLLFFFIMISLSSVKYIGSTICIQEDKVSEEEKER